MDSAVFLLGFSFKLQLDCQLGCTWKKNSGKKRNIKVLSPDDELYLFQVPLLPPPPTLEMAGWLTGWQAS